MKTRSIDATPSDLNRDPAASAISGSVELLPGFIRHVQDARRIERESCRLYAPGDAELEAGGIPREDLARRRDDPYSR